MSFTACGVHIFAGSFTLGIMQAGFEVKAVYENLGLGLQTARENFSFPIIYPKSKWSSYLPKGINLVYANPPCSAFSRMGLNRGSSDPINSCMFECADLAVSLSPDIYIMESVPGLYNSGGDILAELNNTFDAYQHTYLFSDSVLHGSPQIRPRFHYIASRYDFKLSKILDYVPIIRDAIFDLQFQEENEEMNHVSGSISGQLEALIEYIPPGITASDIWRAIPEIRNSSFGQPFGPTRRASYNSPGPTITGGPTIIHPLFNRFLTPRETARIFGYPDDFIFRGNIGNQYAQLGKAVTVNMGQFLGESARLTLQSEEPFDEAEKYIDLLPYSRQAREVQKLDWYGSTENGAKIKKLRKYFGN